MRPRWTPEEGLKLSDPVPATVAWVAAIVVPHALTALGPAGLLTLRTAHQRVAAGGNYAPMIDRGAIWRIWTSLFVHVDLVHLLSNAVAVWVLGRVLEPLVGGWRLSAWMFAGGVAGSYLAHLAGHLQSDGASGGAFALLGAAVVFGWRYRRDLPPADARTLGPVLGAFLVVNLFLSVVLPFIDLVGHLGGLAAGVGLAATEGLRPARALAILDIAWVLGSVAVCAYGAVRIIA